LGTYAIQLLDSGGATIGMIDKESSPDKEFLSASIKLVTGKHSNAPLAATGENQDSCNIPSLNSKTTLDKRNLVVTLLGNDFTGNANTDAEPAESLTNMVQINSNLDSIYSGRFRLQVEDQVGFAYKLVISMTMSTVVGSTEIVETFVGCTGGAAFQISAGSVSAAFGVSKTLFSANFFPRIVRADSTNNFDNYSTTLNIWGEDGLPSPIHILYGTTGGDLLNHANCYGCVQARLIMCSDRLTTKTGYPLCSSVAQAVCATSSADGVTCSHSSTSGDPEWTDTLGGTTIVNLVNGTATFTDLKVRYVIGAGYRLNFMLNAGARSSTAYSPTSSMTWKSSVMVPDPSYTELSASVANTVDGDVSGDFVEVNSAYVNVPDSATSGSLLLYFECDAPDDVTFEAKVIAPSGANYSVHIAVDETSDAAVDRKWSLEQGDDWVWSGVSPSVSVVNGPHKLGLYYRENGLKIRRIKLVGGASACRYGWTAQPDVNNYLAGVSNSFFVRPYKMEMYQQVGGDGV